MRPAVVILALTLGILSFAWRISAVQVAQSMVLEQKLSLCLQKAGPDEAKRADCQRHFGATRVSSAGADPKP